MFPFRKKRPIDPDSLREERWIFSARRKGQSRFNLENDGKYTAETSSNGLAIVLKKRFLFAWIDNPWFRYSSTVIDFSLEFSGSDNFAGGIMLRKVNDENYYYFLVSNMNRFRFDLVFNGHHRTLIPWTGCSGNDAGTKLTIISRRDHFSFFAGGEWIGEIVDDTLTEGRIAFCAQNYTGYNEKRVVLSELVVDSRPIQAERRFDYMTRKDGIPAANRWRLAESLFNQGYFVPAFIQLKQIAKTAYREYDTSLMAGRCAQRLGLYDDARDFFYKALGVRKDSDVLFEIANTHYLKNEFENVRMICRSSIDEGFDSPGIRNLYGNAEYASGNWSGAVGHYEKAMRLDPEMPIFAMNCARALERCGKHEEMKERYIEASRLLLRQEAWDDLEHIVVRLDDRFGDDLDVLALKAKLLYFKGNDVRAAGMFDSLFARSFRDAASFYLRGLIDFRRKKYASAEKFFGMASDEDPGQFIYTYKLAECRIIRGKDPGVSVEPLIAGGEYSGWGYNLACQIECAAENWDAALTYGQKALEVLPDEPDVILNVALALDRTGKDAIGFLTDTLDDKSDPRIADRIGTLYCERGNFCEGIRYYDQALRRGKGNRDILMNAAAACLELDLYSRSEELAVQALDLEPDADVYNMIANIARLKGEIERSEKAYLEALKQDPRNHLVLTNYGLLLQETGRSTEALPLLEKACKLDPDSGRSAELLERIRSNLFDKTFCRICGREWESPKNLPHIASMRIEGTPSDDLPAGKCSECGNVYCIGCVKENVSNSRLLCPRCGVPLKLNDNNLRYIVKNRLAAECGDAKGNSM